MAVANCLECGSIYGVDPTDIFALVNAMAAHACNPDDVPGLGETRRMQQIPAQ